MGGDNSSIFEHQFAAPHGFLLRCAGLLFASGTEVGPASRRFKSRECINGMKEMCSSDGNGLLFP